MTTNSDDVRAFCGLPLDTATRDFIQTQTHQLRNKLDTVRWVSPELWHITLAFYGNITRLQCRVLSETLESIQSRPVRVRFCRLGAFPSVRRTRVVWFGLDDLDGALAALQERVRDISQALGHRLESRPFHPHVTMGRTRRNARVSLERRPELDIGDDANHLTYLTEFSLYESQLGQTGATYLPLQRIPLPIPAHG